MTPSEQYIKWGISVAVHGETVIVDVRDGVAILPPDVARAFAYYFGRAQQEAAFRRRRRQAAQHAEQPA